MHQSIFRPVHIRPDAEHMRADFSGRPPANYRVMGRVHVDPFIVRLADSEAECMDKALNNAALGRFAKREIRLGQFWIEMWSERLSNWVEI
jgi:hypothetical protein